MWRNETDDRRVTSPASKTLFERLHAALPQTQCTRCGFSDCAAYARAIAAGNAAINQCPPGGNEGVQRLAAIIGLPALPLNPANGSEGPRALAVIDEAWCIGCTLCIEACPTDAILGSHKMMHTVIEPYCTGCELCVPVCPVDCISLENVTGTQTGWRAWSQQQADTARQRYESSSYRRPVDKGETAKTSSKKKESQRDGLPGKLELAADRADHKRAVIEAALARARAQREKQA